MAEFVLKAAFWIIVASALIVLAVHKTFKDKD